MKDFTSKEINELILECKIAKENGTGLLTVFNKIAKKYNKASGSIRNLYYKIVGSKEKLFNDTEIPNSLKPAFITEFTRAETKNVIKIILKNKTQGKSVRKTVFELANGNEKLALRYQNKYRNALKTDTELVNETVNELTVEMGRCYNPLSIKNDENVKKIENEINALILRIYNSNERENYKLRKQISDLSVENCKLKKLLKKNLRDNGFTKEFFDSIENFKEIQ